LIRKAGEKGGRPHWAPSPIRLSAAVFTSCLLVLLLTSGICSSPASTAPEIFWGLFTKGEYQGNMASETKNTVYLANPDGATCLDLRSPGKSEVSFTFTLDEKPKEFYALLEIFPSVSILRIEINGTMFHDVQFGEGFIEFFSEGLEISKLLKQGENRITIRLASPTAEYSSKEFKIKSVVFTHDPTVLGSTVNVPNLVPPYAKAFATALLIVTLLYIVWSLLNRSLYKNLDVYSASFAIIGIMIMSIATAYSVVLVKTKIAMTVVFLAIVILLTVIAMLSARKAGISDSDAGGSGREYAGSADSGGTSADSGGGAGSSGGDKENGSFDF
jgi:hypothetical protein